jgi:hypothetical protein
MSDYKDGGVTGILTLQEIQAPHEPPGKPTDPLPWWELAAFIAASVALTCTRVWLFRREGRDRRQ